MEQIEVLLVDIGNTRVKTVEMVKGSFQNPRHWNSFEDVDADYPAELPFVISNVKHIALDQLSREYLSVSAQTSLPILIDYETPDTLGVDRIAAATGAWHLFPNESSVIIDIGTCMTIDFIDENGVFQGGAISPGLKMRLKAMASFTDRLPDIAEEWEYARNSFPGKSTKQSLFHGAHTAMLYEINGYISDLKKKFTSINVILTGGDSACFESYLKPPIFAGSKLVETGLYRIWKYQ